ncbi:NRDE family protein [Bordetella sputigena]|uniref:NRDE family protein n=1 Tax=Bordetella sputigena TaxID=1416810 RepID=UPI0039EEADDB
MCLAVLAIDVLPGIPVLVAANRDEYHARPTAAAAPWKDDPRIIAGRDLQSGGTWMGMTRGGRHALVTNYRDPMSIRPGAPSRGKLVEDFLRGDATPSDYIAGIAAVGADYNGFNLIVGDRGDVCYYSNRGSAPRHLGPGIYALSNHLLDTPWPKLARTKAAFTDILRTAPSPDIEALFDALGDRSVALDAELPDTGVGLERERFLSSAFIVGLTYGTRSSTIMTIGTDHCALYERRFAPDGAPAGRSNWDLGSL